jgi:hypothetical protein
MTRFKPLAFAAGLLFGLAGVVWHRDLLVWAGILFLGAVVVLRLVKRNDQVSPEV